MMAVLDSCVYLRVTIIADTKVSRLSVVLFNKGLILEQGVLVLRTIVHFNDHLDRKYSRPPSSMVSVKDSYNI